MLAYQTDPRYLRFYAWTRRTPQDVQAFVGRFVAQQERDPRLKFQLAIVLPASGHLIGNAGIRIKTAGGHEADIGYELDPQHWGCGYASAWPRTPPRRGCWRSWACGWKAGCATASTSRAVTGTRCTTRSSTTNGGKHHHDCN